MNETTTMNANCCTGSCNNKIVIEIPRELVDLVESYQYEVNARMNLISYCMDRGIDVDNPVFKRYHDEFVEMSVRYEQAKNQISNEYVLPHYSNARWNLDFDSCKLTIEVG